MSDPSLALIKAYIESLEASAQVSDVAAIRGFVKADAEQRFTLGLAYPANVAPGFGADGFNDFATKEVLEKTAWAWMSKSRSMGLYHQDGTEGHGQVVESYIYRGPDWTIDAPDGNAYVIKAGDWLLGTLWDDHGWDLVKRKEVNGLSPQGLCRRTEASPERLASLRTA